MVLIKKLLTKLIIICFFYTANAQSVEIIGLYDVTVAYDMVNFRSNRNAHKKALEKLLIRVMIYRGSQCPWNTLTKTVMEFIQ